MATAAQVQDPSMKRALVVGGQPSFVKEKLAKSLARHGIRIHTHWSWEKRRPPQTFPVGLDLVYICTDMVGHTLSEPCMNWARENGLPYINGTRKWAESIIRLTQGGFPLIDPFTDVPEMIAEIRRTRQYDEMSAGPSQDEMVALAAAFTGSVVAAEEVVATYNAETGHVHITEPAATPPIMPPSPVALETAPMTPINTHLAVTNPKQREYLRALAYKPDADNVDIWETIRVLPPFTTHKFDPERASYARKSLGINIVRKGGRRTTTVNTTLFHATLKTAKIEGYPPPSALYSEPDGAFKNAIKAQPEEVVVPTVAPVAAPPPAAIKPAVVETAPVPFAPAPPAPQPAAKSEKWPNDDFKTLLSLLREHMAIHNLKSLTITETGVSFKRIEVVEGDLAL